MDNWIWISVLGIIAIIAYSYGYRWWKKHQAGKQADELLAHVVKAKDSRRL